MLRSLLISTPAPSSSAIKVVYRFRLNTGSPRSANTTPFPAPGAFSPVRIKSPSSPPDSDQTPVEFDVLTPVPVRELLKATCPRLPIVGRCGLANITPGLVPGARSASRETNSSKLPFSDQMPMLFVKKFTPGPARMAENATWPRSLSEGVVLMLENVTPGAVPGAGSFSRATRCNWLPPSDQIPAR